MGKGFFKYIFVVVVIVLVVYTAYKLVKDDSLEEESLDQTSTVTTIQKNIRLAIAEFDTINPLLSNNRNVQEITKIIFEPLVTLDENYKLEYCLAEEVVKQDDLNYIITLRKGVLWQDGSNFTASDVKFTIDTIKSGISTVYASNIQYVTYLDVIDEYTIKLTLSQAVPFFEYNLTFPILCESYYSGEDFSTTEKNSMPIGTGMFKISSVDESTIKLEKNDIYWDDTKDAMIEEIDINLYSSMGEVYNAFKSGDIDILTVKINNVEDYIGTIRLQ